jgi:iron complex outermembrane receptor protein
MDMFDYVYRTYNHILQMLGSALVFVVLLLALAAQPFVSAATLTTVQSPTAQHTPSSTLQGTVTASNGKPLAGVNIQLNNALGVVVKRTLSAADGSFRFENLEQGSYTLQYSLTGKKTTESTLTIQAGQNSTLSVMMMDELSAKFQDIVVYGASKRAEKITEAPAAVSVAEQQDLTRAARHGILARTLEGFTGVDILQSGATDFIVNARGFNGGLNRRVLVLQDGRDAAMPLLGAQEWNAFSLPIEDFARMEFVRGPAAALYGANAFNGVLNMVSYAPREVLGTKVSLLAGDYQTLRGDVRHAGWIGDNLSYKISLGHARSRNFAASRVEQSQLEYAGLVPERRAIADDERNTFSSYGALRMDYDFSKNERLTGEFGYSRSGNEAYVFGLGRTFVKDVERPYARLAYTAPGWNIQANWMHRNTPDSMYLLAAAPMPIVNGKSNNVLLDRSHDVAVDAQHNFSPSQDVNVVVGVTGQMQLIRTELTSTWNDPNGYFAGAYGQVEWKASSLVKVVGSARFDAASIHAAQFSPRVAVVVSPVSEHQFRVSASRSFQRPNYSELFRRTPAPPPLTPLGGGRFGAPINFTALEQRLLDSLALWSGVPRAQIPALGLNRVTSRAFGNDRLNVEQNLTAEVGYKGIVGENVFVTVDAYYSRLTDFITNFLPGVNTAYPTWKPALTGTLAAWQNRLNGTIDAALGPNAVGLTLVDNVPTFVQSNFNVGAIDQVGVDVGVNYYVSSNLLLGANASWFDFRVVDNASSQPVLPNASPLRGNLSATYTQPNVFDLSVQLRYVEGFDWIAGTFRGRVPAYALVNLSGGVNVLTNVRLGFNVFNLLDRQHYQVFGGTFLPRMATVKVDYTF